MADKKFFGTISEIQNQPFDPNRRYFDIDSGSVFIDGFQGREQLIGTISTVSDDVIGLVDRSGFPGQSSSLVISQKGLTEPDEIEEEEEELESQTNLADSEEEDVLIVTQEERSPVVLNSIIAERESENTWRTKYQLFKKRIYLYREYATNETLYEFENIPYIEPNAANTVNFINRSANIRPQDIFPKGPADEQIWFLSRNVPELRSKPVVVSSVLVFDRNPTHVLQQRKYGDIPSKYIEDQNKVDIILFKNVPIDYDWQASDQISGDLLYDYKLGKLRELEPNAFNGWSAEFVEPDLETEETFAIAIAITSNHIPSYIYGDASENETQWSWPPKPVRTVVRDGEDARNVFLTADKSLTITYNASGTSPNPSGTIVFTATPENFEDPEYSFDGEPFSSLNTFDYTIPPNISGLTPAVNINVIAREVSNNSIQATDQTVVSAVRPGAQGPQGPRGIQGLQGPQGPAGAAGENGTTGPGVVFQGNWISSGKEYFGNSDRADVVFFTNLTDPSKTGYYYCIQTHTNFQGSPRPGDAPTFWTPFGATFDSVATDILLTANANITRGLVMGDQTGNVGFIRSAGAQSKARIINGTDTGFYLDGGDGSITSNAGNIGGWSINATSLTGGAFTSVSTSGFLINNTAAQSNSIMTGNYIKTGRNTNIIIDQLVDSGVDATAGASSPVATLGGLVITGRSSPTSDDSLIASVRSLTIDTRLNNTDITISAARNILLNGQSGGIYATSSIAGASPTTNTQNLVLTQGPFSSRLTPSSQVIKKNIENVDNNELFDFLDKVSIKSFNFIEFPDRKAYSIIIEDEKETPLIKDLIKQQPKATIYGSFQDLPEHLKPYIGTEILQEENGVIYYSPWVVDSTSIGFLSLAIIKEHNNKIKNLEERIEKLENLIESKIKDEA